MTRIHIGKGIFGKTGAFLAEETKGRNIAIVSDSNTWPLYGEGLQKSLEESGFRSSYIILEAGETSKNYDNLFRLYNEFNKADLTRMGLVLALGGGVVGDIAGFAAATYLRGIPVVQVPTTLLAQVDSSIGGKTAIDMPFGKNTVGAFHQPLMVVTDPEVLRTLPGKIFSDGMAEVIKYGCIKDNELFNLSNNIEDLEAIIRRCVEIKVEIVEEDEKDKGVRQLLNFGHTIGHAIEKSLNYSGITHGEAVGIGMIKAAEIGEKLGITEKGTKEQIKEMLVKHKLPIKVDLPVEVVSLAMRADKKRAEDTINFVFIERVGSSLIRNYPLKEICRLLEEVGL